MEHMGITIQQEFFGHRSLLIFNTEKCGEIPRHFHSSPQDGAPVDSVNRCLKKWLNSMVYGRYNELVWLVVWNMNFIFHFIYVILPIDFHSYFSIFFRGVGIGIMSLENPNDLVALGVHPRHRKWRTYNPCIYI